MLLGSYLVLAFTILFVGGLLNLWMLMEFLMFIFMSLGFMSLTSGGVSSEGLIMYYLTQSGLSISLLVSILLCSPIISFMLLLCKLGSFPLNFWMYTVMMNSSMFVLFLMMTFQKLPIMIIINSFSSSDFFILLMLINLLVCGSLALTSCNLKTLLVASSLANNSWFLISLNSSFEVFMILYLVYTFTLFFVLFSCSSLLIFLGVLSLSGLPPFPLFFLKFGALYTYYFASDSLYLHFLSCLFMLFALLLSASYIRYLISSYTSLMKLNFYVA